MRTATGFANKSSTHVCAHRIANATVQLVCDRFHVTFCQPGRRGEFCDFLNEQLSQHDGIDWVIDEWL